MDRNNAEAARHSHDHAARAARRNRPTLSAYRRLDDARGSYHRAGAASSRRTEGAQGSGTDAPGLSDGPTVGRSRQGPPFDASQAHNGLSKHMLCCRSVGFALLMTAISGASGIASQMPDADDPPAPLT